MMLQKRKKEDKKLLKQWWRRRFVAGNESQPFVLFWMSVELTPDMTTM